MKMNKLIDCRKQLGFSQQFMADKLAMDVSNYNRREKGIVKISKTEWKKISEILNVDIKAIFEDGSNSELVPVTKISSPNFMYSIPDFLLENQRKYIEKLEEENTKLKIELERLTSLQFSLDLGHL